MKMYRKHWALFTKHAFAQSCAGNVHTNNFKNKSRFMFIYG